MVHRPANIFRQGAQVTLAFGFCLLLPGCAGDPPPDSMTSEASGPAESRQLAAVAGAFRPFALRLTGGFQHQPCAAERHPICTPAPLELPQVRAVLNDLEKASVNRARQLRGVTTESANPHLHGEAALRLILHSNARDVELATLALEKATAAGQASPDLLNDLAVAYTLWSDLEPSRRGVLRSRALAHAAEAVQKDSGHPEALFNLAALLGEVGLRRKAQTTWERFLGAETDPSWRAEGEEELARLPTPRPGDEWEEVEVAIEEAAAQGDLARLRELVEVSPMGSYQYLEREMYPRWGTAFLSADHATAEAVERRIITLTAVVGEVLHDGTEAANLAILQGVGGDPEGQRRQRAFASGAVGFQEVALLRSEGCPPEREGTLRAAREALHQAESPSAAWMAWGLAVCRYLERDYGTALGHLDRALAGLQVEPFPRLTAWLLRQKGLTLHFSAQPVASADTFNSALHHSQRAGDATLANSIRMMQLQYFEFLNQRRAVLQHHQELLESQARLPQNTSQGILFDWIASSKVAPRPAVVALPFQEEAIAVLRQEGVLDSGVANSLLNLASLRAAHQQIPEAESVLREAAELLAQAGPGTQRRFNLAKLNQVRAELLAREDPEGALALLERVLALLRESGQREAMARVHQTRSRLYRRVGDRTSAEEELRQALTLREATLGDLPTPHETRLAEAHLWKLARDLVDLLAEGDTPNTAALELADHYRSRPFFAAMDPGATLPPFELPSFQSGLTTVHYLALEDRTVAWVTRNGHTVGVRLPLTAALLAALGEEGEALLGASSRRPRVEVDRHLSELFERLIRPLALDLEDSETILFLPLEGFASIPFAALLNRETGRYLVEDYTIARAPSSHVTRFLQQRALGHGPWQPSSILVVGNPAFRADTFPLPPLHHAAAEAQAITDLYGSPPPLLDRAATADAFLRGLQEADLVHFAGHAEARFEPTLLLTPTAAFPSGALLGSDLARVPMRALRLVVLSACNTASAEGASDTEDLVTPFLLAGADDVVASLWQVSDASTRELMIRFHQHLFAGKSSPEALNAAQREMLDSATPSWSHPAAWAAFEVFGAP